MDKQNVQVILGSTRPNREGEKVARWVVNQLEKREDIDVELLDLRDWNLGHFDQPAPIMALNGNYTNETAKKWVAKIDLADAYIMVTPEYNHGYPAVLKDAIDIAYDEWNYKPVAFVSYSGGQFGGVRAVEQLRQVVIETKSAPMRDAVHIGSVWGAFEEDGSPKDTKLNDGLKHVVDELVKWSGALQVLRK